MTKYFDLTEKDKESLDSYCYFLKDNGLVLRDDVLLEFTPNISEAVSISPVFEDLSRIIFRSDFATDATIKRKIDTLQGFDNPNLNLVSNAFSKSVKTVSNLLLSEASLTLGIYTDDSDEFEYGRYNLIQYRNELMAKGIHTLCLEDKLSNGQDVYVLSRRREKE